LEVKLLALIQANRDFKAEAILAIQAGLMAEGTLATRAVLAAILAIRAASGAIQETREALAAIQEIQAALVAAPPAPRAHQVGHLAIATDHRRLHRIRPE
jgi:hypothetical protein